MVIFHFKCARGFVFVCIPHLSLTRRPVFRGSLRAGYTKVRAKICHLTLAT